MYHGRDESYSGGNETEGVSVLKNVAVGGSNQLITQLQGLVRPDHLDRRAIPDIDSERVHRQPWSGAMPAVAHHTVLFATRNCAVTKECDMSLFCNNSKRSLDPKVTVM
jgi:hypothetical protein